MAKLVPIGSSPLSKCPRSCSEGRCPVLKWHMHSMSWFDGLAYLISLKCSMQQTGAIQSQPANLGRETDRKFPSFLISTFFLSICCCLCLLFRRLPFGLDQLSDSDLLRTEKKLPVQSRRW